jgi:hypothetical protein
MIGGLSASMTQQVAAVKDLAKALGNVSEMSRSISASTEQLSGMWQDLQRVMAQFKINGGNGRDRHAANSLKLADRVLDVGHIEQAS